LGPYGPATAGDAAIHIEAGVVCDLWCQKAAGCWEAKAEIGSNKATRKEKETGKEKKRVAHRLER
jgi:hypothetical protein